MKVIVNGILVLWILATMGERNYQETLVGFFLVLIFNTLWWVITEIPDEVIEKVEVPKIHLKIPIHSLRGNDKRAIEIPSELMKMQDENENENESEETNTMNDTAIMNDTTIMNDTDTNTTNISTDICDEDFNLTGDGKSVEGITPTPYEYFPGVIWGVDNSGVIHKTPFHKLRHTCIYGTTGVGKDVLLKMLLCNVITGNNAAVKFIIVDGKGVDYSLFTRYSIPHNIASYITGINCDNQSEALLRGLEQLKVILKRRQELFNRAEVTDIHSFKVATGYVLPQLLFIVTDVDSNVDNKVMTLFAELVKKVRAFGITVIFSTQNPKSVDTTLRSQMTFMMVGRQGSQRQSSMATGKSLSDYEATPPHSLPQEPGLFWFSDSAEEFIVKTPTFDEGLFFSIIKKFAERKRITKKENIKM